MITETQNKLTNLAKQLDKIVVNIGIGKLAANNQDFETKLLPEIIKEAAMITGQKPAVRPARKSIAGFKVREGNIVGLKTTLRGKRMIQFLERLVKVVIPRLRDFQGIDLKSIDEGGNLSIGFREQAVFPEINLESSRVSFGLQVTIVPRVKNREQAIELYRRLGVPIKK